MRRRCLLAAVAAFAIVWAVPAARPAPASADILSIGCKLFTGVGVPGGGVCPAAAHAGLRAGAALIHGHVGTAVGTVAGTVVGAGANVVTRAAFAAIGPWAAAGAASAVKELGSVMSHTTDPQLTSAWFSRTYWRVAGLAVILTVPFLFAAAIQAILRSDPLLLFRSAFAHLPLALLAVQIAAPMTMLLLAASDQMGSLVSSASGDGAGRFVATFAAVTGGLGTIGPSFLALVGALLIVVCALALTLELLLREAAVYVVVLMLPLAFAAMVWPARRAWVVRSLELLVALILSKFVVVAVLALAFGALGELSRDGVGTALAGMALLLLAVLSPWALVRLLPMAEVAAGVQGMLQQPIARAKGTLEGAHRAEGALEDLVARLHPRQAPAGDARAPAADDVRGRLPARSEGGGGTGGRGTGPEGDTEAGPERHAGPERDAEAPGDPPAGDRSGTVDRSAGPTPLVAAGAAAGAAVAGASEAPGASAADDERATREAPPSSARQRSPGMDERWQVPDGGWGHLTLGPDDEATTMPWPKDGFVDGDDGRPEPQEPQDGRL